MPDLVTAVALFRDEETADLTAGDLLADLLKEQRHLDTAVTRFSEWHETHEPDQARHYRHLIPTARPGHQEQYAFEVKLDECTGCKACVAACHSLNGLDDDESWRDIGALVTRTGIPYQQTVTTACHHCEDPACANGCPVLAYEKDPKTGIVRHLDDQCIGCSYCILKCPYDVPKFNERLGIVRKCDMCTARLAEGEAPACVQACPNGAIGIQIVPQGQFSSSAPLLPGVVISSYTRPTTRYLTDKHVPLTATAADADFLRVEHAHYPLVVMLVMTQVAAGLILAASILPTQPLLIGANAVLQIGLAASVLHLGQPLRAWRAFLGWRKSWLSREIIALSAFAGTAIVPLQPFVDLPIWPAAILGLVGVFASVMVYVDTLRPDWRMSQTAGRFFGTVLIATAYGLAFNDSRWMVVASALVVTKAAWSAISLLRQPLSYSSRMHRLALPRLSAARYLLALAVAFLGFVAPIPAMALALASELLERTLFFKTVKAWRMPGV